MIIPSASSPPRQRGMTLVEVIIALTVATMIFAGVLAGFIQSRRLTEGSVAQNIATAAVESYMEQMKNMPMDSLVNGLGQLDANGYPIPHLTTSYIIPTQQSDTISDGLKTSTGTPPVIGTFPAGTTPDGIGIVDNLKDIAADPNNTGSGSTWPVTWPGATKNANSYITNSTPLHNDLHLNIWVWVQDLSTPAGAHNAYGITLIYTWQFWDGVGNQYFMGTLHTIRSAVPTY